MSPLQEGFLRPCPIPSTSFMLPDSLWEISLPSALLRRRPHFHSLPPGITPTLGLPTFQGADAHPHQGSRVPHSQSPSFRPQTHRVPLGAIIACRAFRPWWSSLSGLPSLSFLTTFTTWTLQGEWREKTVSRCSGRSRSTLKTASASPPSLGDRGTESGLWGVSWPLLLPESRKWWPGSFRPERKPGADFWAAEVPDQEAEKVREQLKVKGVRGQGLRIVTHLDTRLTLDAWRPRLSRLPLQRDEHQVPPKPDNPTSQSKIGRNLTLTPLTRGVHSPLFSYLVSRGTQVPNTSRGTLWALEEKEKPL